MYRRTVISGFVSLLAGCAGLDTGPPSAEVIPDLHEQAIEDDGFVVDVELRTNAHRAGEPATFDNVSIACYDENQEQIAVYPVGTISSDPPRNAIDLTVRAPSIPYYIVVESDDFWTQNHLEMNLAGWKQFDADQFAQYRYGSRENKFSG